MDSSTRKAWKYTTIFTKHNSQISVLQDNWNIDEHLMPNFDLVKVEIDFSNKGWGNTITFSGLADNEVLKRDAIVTFKKEFHDYILTCYLPEDFSIFNREYQVKLVEVRFNPDSNNSGPLVSNSSILFIDKYGTELAKSSTSDPEFRVDTLHTDTIFQDRIRQLQKELKESKEEAARERAHRVSVEHENDNLASMFKDTLGGDRNFQWDYLNGPSLNDQICWTNNYLNNSAFDIHPIQKIDD